MSTFAERAEEQEMFRQKPKDHSGAIFKTGGSAGSNNEELAKIITGLDIVFSILGWDDVNITSIITQNQASIDGTYHKDYKDIAVAVEKTEKARPTFQL